MKILENISYEDFIKELVKKTQIYNDSPEEFSFSYSRCLITLGVDLEIYFFNTGKKYKYYFSYIEHEKIMEVLRGIYKINKDFWEQKETIKIQQLVFEKNKYFSLYNKLLEEHVKCFNEKAKKSNISDEELKEEKK